MQSLRQRGSYDRDYCAAPDQKPELDHDIILLGPSWVYVYVGDTQIERKMQFEADVKVWTEDGIRQIEVVNVYPESKDLYNIFTEDNKYDANDLLIEALSFDGLL